MISFTELESNHATRHRREFGQFGIVMSPTWVIENKLQKVSYIEKHGLVHEALSSLFNIGYSDLKSKIRYPEDGAWNMAYTNKAMSSAVVGSSLWSNLLQIYEYLEPICNSYQQEWRVVQELPLYGYKETKEEIIKNISPPVGWASVISVLKVLPENISGFICPSGEKSRLLEILPNEYKKHSIETFKTYEQPV